VCKNVAINSYLFNVSDLTEHNDLSSVHMTVVTIKYNKL